MYGGVVFFLCSISVFREKDITASKIRKILASGANVILTTQGIDDMAMKYFVEAGALAVRRVDRRDLKRIAKITDGAHWQVLDGLEAFDTWLGYIHM